MIVRLLHISDHIDVSKWYLSVCESEQKVLTMNMVGTVIELIGEQFS